MQQIYQIIMYNLQFGESTEKWLLQLRSSASSITMVYSLFYKLFSVQLTLCKLGEYSRVQKLHYEVYKFHVLRFTKQCTSPTRAVLLDMLAHKKKPKRNKYVVNRLQFGPSGGLSNKKSEDLVAILKSYILLCFFY